MRHYYLALLVGLALLSGAAMISTYKLITLLPLNSQPLAAGILLAFEGFIFGGAFQFLLEGRRMLYRDRNERIRRYHLKLKKHVIDYWNSREVERRQSLGDHPQSLENLYLVVDLGSFNDPDSRYLNDTLKHLRAQRYQGSIEMREGIEAAVRNNNSEVHKLCQMTANLQEKAGALGFVEQNISTQDSPAIEAFNTGAVRQYLEAYHASPRNAELRTEDSRPASTLYFRDQWQAWRIVALSEDLTKVKELYTLLAEFASEYSEVRRRIEAGISSVQASLKNFKDWALTTGYDIEEEIFEGQCTFEARVNS